MQHPFNILTAPGSHFIKTVFCLTLTTSRVITYNSHNSQIISIAGVHFHELAFLDASDHFLDKINYHILTPPSLVSTFSFDIGPVRWELVRRLHRTGRIQPLIHY